MKVLTKQIQIVAVLLVGSLVFPASGGPATVIDAGSLHLQKRVQYLSTQNQLMQSDFTELQKSHQMIKEAYETAEAGNLNLARVQVEKGIRQFRNHHDACMANLERGIDAKMNLLFSILGADPNTSDAQRESYREMAKQLKADLQIALTANDEFRIALLKLRLKQVYLLLQGPAALQVSEATHRKLQDSLKRSIISANQAIVRLTEQGIQFDVLEIVAATWGNELDFADGVGTSELFPDIIKIFTEGNSTLNTGSLLDLVDVDGNERYTDWFDDIPTPTEE